MSLSALRELRLQGKKPAVVQVVLGQRPRLLDDDAGLIVVRPSDEPKHMDWRPMVGICALILAIEHVPARTLATMEALHGMGCPLFGVAMPQGVFPLLIGATQEHELALQRAWNFACHS